MDRLRISAGLTTNTNGDGTQPRGDSIVVTFYALVFGIPTEKVLGSKKYFVVGLLAQMVSAPLAK